MMFNKYRRFVAFIIDMFIVSYLALAISSNYNYNPYLYDMDDAYKEFEAVKPTFDDLNDTKNMEEYMKDLSIKTYEVQKTQVYVYGWYLLFYFLYFVVFAYFTEGQTLGKRFTKLKIVKKDGSRVGIINLLLRCLTNGSSLFLGLTLTIVLNIIGVFIFNGEIYYSLYCTFVALICSIIEIANIAMFSFTKDNTCLNDKISRSKVIVIK